MAKIKLSEVTEEATTFGVNDRLYIVQDSTTKFIRKATLESELGLSFAGDNFDVSFHSNAAGNVTLTSQASAEQFLSNSNRNVVKVDLTNKSQCRLMVRVITGSASANDPRIRLRYKTTSYSDTIGDYSEIGETEVSCSMATNNTLIDSGWIDIVEGAKADVYVCVSQIGGDASASPVIASIHAQFK